MQIGGGQLLQPDIIQITRKHRESPDLIATFPALGRETRLCEVSSSSLPSLSHYVKSTIHSSILTYILPVSCFVGISLLDLVSPRILALKPPVVSPPILSVITTITGSMIFCKLLIYIFEPVQ
jgi:hypothetical protein